MLERQQARALLIWANRFRRMPSEGSRADLAVALQASVLTATDAVKVAPLPMDMAHSLSSFALASFEGDAEDALTHARDIGRDLHLDIVQLANMQPGESGPLQRALLRAVEPAQDLKIALSLDPLASPGVAFAAGHGLYSRLVLATPEPPVKAVVDALILASSIVCGLAALAVSPPSVPGSGSGQLPAPEDEERATFERVWGLAETAFRSAGFPAARETEIRSLYEMRSLAAQLDPESYGDLYDDVTRRIAAAIPDVLSVIDPELEVPRSLVDLTSGASYDEQLEALVADTERAAVSLELARASISDQPSDHPVVHGHLEEPAQPLFEPTVERLHQLFRRVDATRTELAMTKTGRALLRGVGGALSTVAGAAASPLVGAITASAAVIYAAIGDWIYTLLRRQHRHLPPRYGGDDAGT